jgi:hypothetical protein
MLAFYYTIDSRTSSICHGLEHLTHSDSAEVVDTIKFKVSLNTTFIIYRVVKQLHVSILYMDHYQASYKNNM